MNRYFVAAVLAGLCVPASANAQVYLQLQLGLDAASTEAGSHDGFTSGVSVGYDLPVSQKLYVGIEGSADDSTNKKCVFDVITPGDKLCEKTGRDLGLTAHIGTKLSETAKLYALAGYSNAVVTENYSDATGTIGINRTFDGLRVGAGFKKDLTGQAFVKVEYRYANYERGFSRHNALVAVGANF